MTFPTGIPPAFPGLMDLVQNLVLNPSSPTGNLLNAPSSSLVGGFADRIPGISDLRTLLPLDDFTQFKKELLGFGNLDLGSGVGPSGGSSSGSGGGGGESDIFPSLRSGDTGGPSVRQAPVEPGPGLPPTPARAAGIRPVTTADPTNGRKVAPTDTTGKLPGSDQKPEAGTKIDPATIGLISAGVGAAGGIGSSLLNSGGGGAIAGSPGMANRLARERIRKSKFFRRLMADIFQTGSQGQAGAAATRFHQRRRTTGEKGV